MPTKSTAALTEHLPAADNHDPSIDGPATITYVVDGRNTWTVDSGGQLPADPEDYYVECEGADADCGETFDTWQAAIEHAEREHPGLGDRTSILAYEQEVETMKRAKRHLEADRDEDLALHEALVILADDYLDDA